MKWPSASPPRGPGKLDADRSPLFYEHAADRQHPWTQGQSNTLRVAVIGDSFTRGVGVQLDDRYGARIERLLNLNSGALPAEVLVFGRAGTSTFQQLTLLREALARQPHIVILGICLNDTEDWAKPGELEQWRNKWMPRRFSAFQVWWIRHSRLATWIIERGRAALSTRGCVTYYRHLYAPDYTGLLRFQKALQIFRDECAAQQAAFVPVIFPLLSFDFSPNRYPLPFAHERIHDICRTLGVPYLDLLPAFQGTSPGRMQVIPGIDPHPSEIAHRIAAEAIMQHLLEQGQLNRGYRFVERPSSVRDRAIWTNTLARFQFLPEPKP